MEMKFAFVAHVSSQIMIHGWNADIILMYIALIAIVLCE